MNKRMLGRVLLRATAYPVNIADEVGGEKKLMTGNRNFELFEFLGIIRVRQDQFAEVWVYGVPGPFLRSC